MQPRVGARVSYPWQYIEVLSRMAHRWAIHNEIVCFKRLVPDVMVLESNWREPSKQASSWLSVLTFGSLKIKALVRPSNAPSTFSIGRYENAYCTDLEPDGGAEADLGLAQFPDELDYGLAEEHQTLLQTSGGCIFENRDQRTVADNRSRSVLGQMQQALGWRGMMCEHLHDVNTNL